MIHIGLNDNQIKVNDLGFIVYWSFSPLISETHPIYMVLFEEYSRINPFCQPFDMSESIDVIFWNDTKISYIKKIGKFFFNYDIRVVENGIDWSLSCDPACANHSTGIALPYYRDWCDFSRNPIKENIANYSNSFRLYSDQHILDIPCICSEKSAVFGNTKNNYQFFRYQEGDTHWMRTTTSTSSPVDNAVDICIRTNVENIEIRETYLIKFPETDTFINKWKSQFKELGERFNVNIIYQQSKIKVKGGDVTHFSNSCPTEKDLEKFYPILKTELEKYPTSFFKDLGIKCIQLVTDLWILVSGIKKKIDGRLWIDENTGLILDIQSHVGVIHHEIFHGIQQRKRFDHMPGEISQISDFAETDETNEYLAELFSMLMTNPGKAYNPASGIIPEQISYLKKEVKDFLDFPNLPSCLEQRKIFAITSSSIIEIKFGDICEEAISYTINPSGDTTCQSS